MIDSSQKKTPITSLQIKFGYFYKIIFLNHKENVIILFTKQILLSSLIKTIIKQIILDYLSWKTMLSILNKIA